MGKLGPDSLRFVFYREPNGCVFTPLSPAADENPTSVERMPRIMDFKTLAIVGTVVPSTTMASETIKVWTTD